MKVYGRSIKVGLCNEVSFEQGQQLLVIVCGYSCDWRTKLKKEKVRKSDLDFYCSIIEHFMQL
jgi:hypothetical protein